MFLSVIDDYPPVKHQFRLFSEKAIGHTLLMSMGDQIKQARLRRGLSQQEVGRQFGISRAAVAQWESGKNRPDHAKLVALAEYLQINLSELLADLSEEPYPAPSKTERNELTEAWSYLLPGERETFLQQIKECAAHNRAVMETFTGKAQPKRQPFVERRQGGVVYYGGPERRKVVKDAEEG